MEKHDPPLLVWSNHRPLDSIRVLSPTSLPIVAQMGALHTREHETRLSSPLVAALTLGRPPPDEDDPRPVTLSMWSDDTRTWFDFALPFPCTDYALPTLALSGDDRPCSHLVVTTLSSHSRDCGRTAYVWRPSTKEWQVAPMPTPSSGNRRGCWKKHPPACMILPVVGQMVMCMPERRYRLIQRPVAERPAALKDAVYAEEKTVWILHVLDLVSLTWTEYAFPPSIRSCSWMVTLPRCMCPDGHSVALYMCVDESNAPSQTGPAPETVTGAFVYLPATRDLLRAPLLFSSKSPPIRMTCRYDRLIQVRHVIAPATPGTRFDTSVRLGYFYMDAGGHLWKPRIVRNMLHHALVWGICIPTWKPMAIPAGGSLVF
jgi:hypothetical protein